jgi:hypothetical protein
MLQLFLFLGIGLLLASCYSMFARKSEHKVKLERVRREIAAREQAARDRAVAIADTDSDDT